MSIPSASARPLFGLPREPDAPYDPQCVAAFVTGLIGFPFAWILAIRGAASATLTGRKGRVMAAIGGALGTLWTGVWAVALLLRFAG